MDSINISEGMEKLLEEAHDDYDEDKIDIDLLDKVTGGMYGDDESHELEMVGTNGTEIVYKGIDTCPVCKKRMDTYFYQQGDYFACYNCAFGKKYKPLNS